MTQFPLLVMKLHRSIQFAFPDPEEPKKFRILEYSTTTFCVVGPGLVSSMLVHPPQLKLGPVHSASTLEMRTDPPVRTSPLKNLTRPIGDVVPPRMTKRESATINLLFSSLTSNADIPAVLIAVPLKLER